MTHMEEDFAATTTIGERVAPPAPSARKTTARAQGPSFGVPAKLEPFTLLAKSARGAGAAALVLKACAAPGVYVFSELLALPSIKDLKTSDQHKSSYELLEIFAYGTWAEYEAKRESHSLPALDKAQETKLKLLTILTLALDNRIIPYSTLLSSLSLPSIPALEDLLIEGFYSNVLKGRLDQREGRLEVMSSLGRDVRPSTSTAPPTAVEGEPMEVDSSSAVSVTQSPSIATLTSALTSWLTTIQTLLTSLDRHIAKVAADSVNSSNALAEQNEAIEKMVHDVSKSKDKGASKDSGDGGWKDSLVGAADKVLGTASGSGGGDVDMDAGGPSVRGKSPSKADTRMRKRGRT